MTHEDAREVLPFYALGGLDAATRAQVDAHVRGCAICHQALAEEAEAFEAVGRAVPQVRPPAALRQRVLDSLDGVTRVPAVSTNPSRATGFQRWHWVAAAAATVAIVTSVGLVSARRELANLRAELRTWQLRLADAEDRAVRAASDANSQRRVISVLTSTDLVEATLSGVAPATDARARAFLSVSSGTFIFTAHGLPTIPNDRTYQLWAIVGTTPVSAGVFRPDAEGRSQLIGQLPTLDGRPTTIAVTVEPSQGVPKPTGPIYLAGSPSN